MKETEIRKSEHPLCPLILKSGDKTYFLKIVFVNYLYLISGYNLVTYFYFKIFVHIYIYLKNIFFAYYLESVTV